MAQAQFKLKQASAVLGVSQKELQNLVQFGVIRPKKRNDVFWFDTNQLLLAKIAFYVKASLRTSVEYLAQLTKELSRVDLERVTRASLVFNSSPGQGMAPIEIKIPFRELKNEFHDSLPMAEIYRDRKRGRKSQNWQEEMVETLQEIGKVLGDVSEQDILKQVQAYRRDRKKRPEVRVVAPVRKSA